MIVEINFLDPKKKRNMVPYLLGLMTVAFLTASGYWMFQEYQNLQEQQAQLQQEINENRQIQQEYESRTNLAAKRSQLNEQITQLEQEIFPTVPLLKQMVSMLPETGYFDNYSFSLNSDISLVLRVDRLEDVAAYMHSLESQAYVESADVSNISVNTANESRTYIASFQVSIDQSVWMGEVDER
ncbi:PilN domain-containing protein [Aquibacillus sediminis]|uniref:PilN domain-containing protein n=1 Tax=Aquibacillus sediminis TaxID=2574734 RepID=UPI0011081D7E|nr:hypothetical protein [Aquibacillus sediminis]